jgi:hypothetical protein
MSAQRVAWDHLLKFSKRNNSTPVCVGNQANIGFSRKRRAAMWRLTASVCARQSNLIKAELRDSVTRELKVSKNSFDCAWIPAQHWLDYDSVALTVLMIAISILELLVFCI